MGTVLFFVVVGAAVWVGFDAKSLGISKGRLGGGALDMSVFSWVVCCLLLSWLSVPAYLVARHKYKNLRNPMPSLGIGVAAPAAWGASPVVNQPGFSQPATVIPGYNAQEAPVIPTQSMPVATAPPQLSPDGHWWWDGAQWVPVADFANRG